MEHSPKSARSEAKGRLHDIVRSMENGSVLVAGDIMLDRFVYGSVDRISPESPVPVLSIKREDRMLGGAGNALANLSGLRAGGAIVALVGRDSEGAEVRRAVQDTGFDPGGLIEDPLRPTIVKTRFLAGHQQLLRTDFERPVPVSDDLAARVLETASAYIAGAGCVILSDYDKGLLRPDVVAGIIKMARERNIPVIVDPKGNDYSRYHGAAAVTPNRKELGEATGGMPTATDADIESAANHLIRTCGIRAVIATRSADGLSVIAEGMEPLHMKAADVEVFDVSGAGDTVIATIAAALAAGASLHDAARLANIAGGIVVAKVGTAPIRAAELLDSIEEEEDGAVVAARKGAAQAGMMGLDEAAELVRRWHARGLKVGFTNGCFDILHFGHVSYLAEARRRCDRLIVGLNRDTSVRILKGAGRPVHDEASRAAVLAALSAVDAVVLFGAERTGEDNTASALLSRLHPDIYFKGGDYRPDQIPELPAVLSYGGKVEIMSAFDGHSTTGSIKKAGLKAV